VGKIVFCFLFSVSIVSAASINLNSLSGVLKSNDSSSSSFDKVFDDIKKSALQEIRNGMVDLKSDLTGALVGEVDRIAGDTINKAKKLVDKADKEFDELISMKNKVSYYVGVLKKTAAWIGTGMLGVALSIFLIFLKVKKSIKNKGIDLIPNFKNISASLVEINRKLDILLEQKK
jgi:hypothetical protein